MKKKVKAEATDLDLAILLERLTTCQRYLLRPGRWGVD